MSVLQDVYREYPPTPALRQYVECYWSSIAPAPAGAMACRLARQATSPAEERRVLPDGCIDIIFDLSEETKPYAKIVGTMTRPLLFHASGPIWMVAVRFRPGGATPFLRMAAKEITDSHCELPASWHADQLAEQMLDDLEPTIGVRRIEQALLLRANDAPTVDARIQSAVSLAAKRCNTETIAKKVGLSRQHLTRLFQEHVGVGPKVFSRVRRLQSCVSAIKRQNRPNWPALALDAGYHDQAHMISECRQLTGLTPTVLAAR